MRFEHWLYTIPLRLRSLFRRDQVEQDLSDELQYHVDQQIQNHIAKGLQPDEARYAALRAIGGIDQRKEQCRDMRRVKIIEHTVQDIRYALRIMRKNPGFTAIAVLTLTLGIGANTAIFNMVNAVLLKPLHFEKPEQLVVVYEKRVEQGRLRGLVAPPDFFDWQEQNHLFTQMSAYTTALFNLTGTAEPERVWGMITTPGIFATLGVQPMLGRDFTSEDGQSGVPGTVILSHGLWQRRFGSSPDIVGKPIRLDSGNYTVVGVMPPDFRFVDKKFEVWRCMTTSGYLRTNRDFYFLTVIARLRPDVTIAQAQSEMDAIAHQLEGQFPQSNRGHGVGLYSLNEESIGGLRQPLLLLLGAVALVLLIACANVASLSLARAAARHKEITIRAALGAGRGRLVRQLLTESLIFSLLGGGFGLLLSIWGVRLLTAVGSGSMPRLEEVHINGRVLGFTLIISILTAVMCGLLPALNTTKLDLSSALKETSKSASGANHGLVRRLLVVSEIALAVVLLVGAGLLLRSFARLLTVDPGFATEQIVAIDLSLNGGRFANRRHIFMDQLMQRLRALPGVQSVGSTTHLPLSGEDGSRSFSVLGEAAKSEGEKLVSQYRIITPDYLQTMKIPLRSGRYFTERDQSEYFTSDGRITPGFADYDRNERDAPGVAIINESLAHRCFPDVNPLGKRLMIDDGSRRVREIVGVIGRVKHFGLDQESKPEIYLPYAQRPTQNQTLVIRTAGDPTAIVAAVRGEIRALDKDLPLYGIRTMEDYLTDSVAARRLNLLLLGIFAAVALMLAAIGIYGVISYSVAQRTQEIGIRMALGAQKGDVLRMILKQGMILAVFGVVTGLMVSLAVTRLMQSLLFGISATDPVTFVGISVLLTTVAFLACYLPARRAVKVDPMVALRYE